MSREDREAVIAAWWEHHRLSSGTRAERKALEQGRPASVVSGYEAVRDIVDAGDAGSVRFLVDLNDAAPAGDSGHTVGAGPLEDLITEHGDRLIDEIEECARQNPTFKDALRSVWWTAGTLNGATEARLGRWIAYRPL